MPMVFGSALLIPLGLYIWIARGREPRARFGALTLFAGSVWMMGYAAELYFPDIPKKIIAERIQFVGVAIMPTTWFVYALYFSGMKQWLSKRRILAYGVIPILTLFLAYTNDYHHLVYMDFTLVRDGSITAIRHAYGPWLWFFMAYCFVMVGFSFLFLSRMLFKQHRLYRGQIWIIILSTSIICLTVFIKQFAPMSIDLEPYAIALIAPLVGWAIYRLRLGDIIPVARKIVFDSISDVIFILDKRYRILDLNLPARQLFGVGSTKVVGKPIEDVWLQWPDLIGPDLVSKSMPEEIAFEDKGGRRIFECRISPLVDMPRNETIFIVVLHEVTEKKKAELKIWQAYQKLKNTQAQLVQSAKLASIGELASGIAHELNQPLMVIRGNSQLIARSRGKNGSGSGNGGKAVDLIEKSTSRMMKIVNHLRAFSRQSIGDFGPQDINRIVEDAFLMIEEQMRVHDIVIRKDLTARLPAVMADANQLEQVFLNLFTNARDAILKKRECLATEILATAKQIGCIDVTTRLSDSYQRDMVEIIVGDDGCGIDNEHVGKVFDPFFTTKEVGHGTGLGLSISYGIVQDHNGKIEIAETGPKGTRIRMTLLTHQRSERERL